MADGTKIEWTEATWNPVTGCSVHSPGCTNCYAMKLAGTRLAHHPSRAGLTTDTKAGPVWTGEVRFNEQWLADPLRWKRPRMIFVCAHGDLFHESVPDAWIDRVFAVMALCPQHTFQVLTKRSARMWAYFDALIPGEEGGFGDRQQMIMATNEALTDHGFELPASYPDTPWPLPNVWLGVSVEDQQRADERIPDLLNTPAAVRWLSCEPLLGAVDLTAIRMQTSSILGFDALEGRRIHKDDWENWTAGERLDWIVAGGESGPAARPMHPDWARSLRDQCAAAGVPFFFKQWGEWTRQSLVGKMDGIFLGNEWTTTIPWNPGGHRDGATGMQRVGKRAAGRLLDGVTHDAMPVTA